jgi:acetyl-CoA carboxylase/biotin carboxylase 1
MEAKGCAKPLVWKNARRHFYWALRARLARDKALAEISRANPRLSYDSLVAQLDLLLPQGLNSDLRAVAEQIEGLKLDSTLVQLRSNYALQQMDLLALHDRKSLLSGVSRLIGSLSEEERTSVLMALQSTRSGGESSLLAVLFVLTSYQTGRSTILYLIKTLTVVEYSHNRR